MKFNNDIESSIYQQLDLPKIEHKDMGKVLGLFATDVLEYFIKNFDQQMSSYNKRKHQYKTRLREGKIEAQNDKKRLKALPESIRKLETELCDYIELMEVYDGYISDFTGETVPVDPIENPFAVLKEMELNLPHPNALNNDSVKQYIEKIDETCCKMGFNLGTLFFEETRQLEIYNFLYFYINNPPTEKFDDITRLKYKNISLSIERCNFGY